MPILTNRLIEAKWDVRKLTDIDCKGFYASKNSGGVTFNYKFTDQHGNRRSLKMGDYHREAFDVNAARAAVYAMKGRIGRGENVIQTARIEHEAAIAGGRTVDQVIAERIEWMKTPERKADGELRPRIETWANIASHLQRFMSPRLGRKLICEVTRRDIAEVSDSLVADSVSSARHFRRAASGLFNWAIQPPREYVTTSPCDHLPKLPKEHACERALSAAEIKTLWHGLDGNLPTEPKTRLAIRFALATMLRSAEFLPLRRDEIVDLDGEFPVAIIPAKRVKKRRKIIQPLSPLAVSIIKQAIQDGDEYVFQSDLAVKPIHRHAMSVALRGRADKKHKGICELLGLKPFTPHDLRRTAATLAGSLDFSDSSIAACLDHQAKGPDAASAVTLIYNRDPKTKQKARVLNGVAIELTRIVTESDERLAA